MNCTNCGRPIYKTEQGTWMHRYVNHLGVAEGGETDCRLSATPPTGNPKRPNDTLRSIRRDMPWWRRTAHEYESSARHVEIYAGHLIVRLLDAVEHDTGAPA